MADALLEPVTTIESSQCENSRYSAAGSSVQGWRTKMEDSHCHILSLPADPDAAFFGVFDGHNGARIAKYAADNLHEFVFKRPEYRRNRIKRALELGFLDCDAAMRVNKSLTQFESKEYDEVETRIKSLRVLLQKENEKQVIDEESKNAKRFLQETLDGHIDYKTRLWSYIVGGSTANTVFIKDDKVYCANVGDSRAVASVGGRLLELSRDHKPCLPDEAARIEAAGARVSWTENRVEGLALSRAFGDYWSKRPADKPPEQQIITAFPEVRMRKLKPDWEFILLACDGVWDTMTSQEAVSFVRERLGRGERPGAITEALVKRCLGDPPNPQCRAGWGGPGCDNITALLVCCLHDLPYDQLSRRCAQRARGEPKASRLKDKGSATTPALLEE